MKLNRFSVLTILGGGLALPAKEILKRLKQSGSKSGKLKDLLNDMVSGGDIRQQDGNYFLAESHLVETKIRGKKPKRGQEIISVKRGRQNQIYDSPRGDEGKAQRGVLYPGDSPRALVSGRIVEISLEGQNVWPWDLVFIRGNNLSGSSRNRPREVYGRIEDNLFVPFGFPYLKIPLGKNRIPNGNLTRVEVPVSSSSRPAKFLPLDYTPRDFKNRADDIYRKNEVPLKFSPDSLGESEKVRQVVTVKQDKRADLRELPFITIDGAHAKDFDDAIYAEQSGRGFLIYVAIADVSEYVPIGSALDEEAAWRGNSYYLAEKVFPMLPEALSNGVCSLRPDVNRLAMVCEIFLSNEGEARQTKIYPAYIRSAARVTYEEVNSALDGGEFRKALIAKGLDKKIELYLKIAKILREKRLIRGMIDFSFPETVFEFDERGVAVSMSQKYSGPAEGMIEQFMLEANEAVANEAIKHKIPVIWRNHEPPQSEKIPRPVYEFLRQLGLKFSAAMTQSGINEMLHEIRSSGLDSEMELMILRTMSQADYAVFNSGHFGLASPAYLHFTSPIRRYADLVTHRAVKSWLAGNKLNKASRETAARISYTERTAAKAESETDRLKKCECSLGLIGQVVEAKISRALFKGLVLRLLDSPIDAFLTEEFLFFLGFIYSEANKTFVGKSGTGLINGTIVKVRITGIEWKKIEFKAEPAEDFLVPSDLPSKRLKTFNEEPLGKIITPPKLTPKKRNQKKTFRK